MTTSLDSTERENTPYLFLQFKDNLKWLNVCNIPFDIFWTKNCIVSYFDLVDYKSHSGILLNHSVILSEISIQWIFTARGLISSISNEKFIDYNCHKYGSVIKHGKKILCTHCWKRIYRDFAYNISVIYVTCTLRISWSYWIRFWSLNER